MGCLRVITQKGHPSFLSLLFSASSFGLSTPTLSSPVRIENQGYNEIQQRYVAPNRVVPGPLNWQRASLPIVKCPVGSIFNDHGGGSTRKPSPIVSTCKGKEQSSDVNQAIEVLRGRSDEDGAERRRR